MSRLLRGMIAALALSGASANATTLPLTVDYPILQAALAAQIGTTGGPVVLWGEAGSCRFLTVSKVSAGPSGGQVRVTALADARVGFKFLGFCIAPVSWAGVLETVSSPSIGRDWQLRLSDLRSRLLDRKGHPATVAGRLWDLMKGRFESELAAFIFDLAPPAEDAKAFLRTTAGSAPAAPLLAALDTFRPLEAAATDTGVRILASIDLPPAVGESGQAEPALAPIELAAWQSALERWDAFVVFVVRDLGLLGADEALKTDLLEILLRTRHELLSILGTGPTTGEDPVRRLFLQTWSQLRAVVRKAAAEGTLRERVLRYAGFLLAGDALAALDTAAPSLGLEVSADGLRRLARILEPEYPGDPLEYSDAIDAELRDLFGFHDPAMLEPGEPQTRWWQPRIAYAATEEMPREITERLQRWVPENSELTVYRDAVGRLLGTVATRTASANAVQPRFQRLYGDLVHTTAWQESCWRQFVKVDGKVTFLRSKSGDIGIMQVNRRVWRGFFDLEKLRWDIGYNAGAGAEILAQLLNRYGVREADPRLENAARATYSAYNGGPDAYRRYRAARVARILRRIDAAFWEKFQAIAAGRALDYVLCTESWGAVARAGMATVPAASIPKCRMSSRSS